jgi:hypothetical protein
VQTIVLVELYGQKLVLVGLSSQSGNLSIESGFCEVPRQGKEFAIPTPAHYASFLVRLANLCRKAPAAGSPRIHVCALV